MEDHLKNWLLPVQLLAIVLVCAIGVPAQTPTGQDGLRLETLEQIAIGKNPTIARAEARIEAARGRAHQAGLYPNPSVGATGDEISPGPIIRGGEFGFFVQQDIVLGGKLSKSRSVFEQEVKRAQTEAEAQKTRVLNSVRILFYRGLAAQRKVEVRSNLRKLVDEAVTVSKQLQNVGQADQPDVLQIEVEDERAELELVRARNELQQIWQELTATVGDPSMKPVTLAGDVEALPNLQRDAALNALLQESPEIKAAETGIARAEASLNRARVEKIPNLDFRGGVRYNRELLEVGEQPVGLEGFFDVGVRIPLFDRNQGGVQAARAELTQAQREADRVRLSLRARLSRTFKEYIDARDAAERYKIAMLPRAQKAYDMYLIRFRQMAAAYPQALIAQRTLLELQEEYSNTLATAWAKAIEIRGLLLTGGLENSDLSSPDKENPR